MCCNEVVIVRQQEKKNIVTEFNVVVQKIVFGCEIFNIFIVYAKLRPSKDSWKRGM